jgi:hypothetical protein
MMIMITPLDVIMKIARHGSDSLTHAERVFVVEIFRAAVFTSRKDVLDIKHRIQQAHLEYCLKLRAIGYEYD